ncbi:MAG: ATP-binding protein [Gammaproteobacteria bacterium]|nr:ATP-binding protein [Gammaproteobacteria bacterium]
MTPITLEAIAHVLTKLAEKSESVYWLSSPDFKRIAYVSPAYEKIWGRTRDVLYSEPELWMTYRHPDDIKSHHPIHEMAEKIKQLGADARYEDRYRIIRPDGEIRWIYDRGFPVYDEANNCCGVTGIALDITREKLAEITLRKAKKKAEHANQLKTEFIRNMEHDIRTPLSGIEGLAAILREQEINSEKKEWLADIAYSARDLLNYCNGILDFSRIEAGTMPVLKKRFELRQLLTEIIAIEMPAAKLKKLNLHFECEDNIPAFLLGDSYRLKQVLINLISNAIKFTHEGHVILFVKVAYDKSKQRIILAFAVQDTGIGIPKEKQDFIFEKFARLTPANRERYKGPGLGLRIVKKFVEEMGGSIELESESGKGSTFTCVLPFCISLKS